MFSVNRFYRYEYHEAQTEDEWIFHPYVPSTQPRRIENCSNFLKCCSACAQMKDRYSFPSLVLLAGRILWECWRMKYAENKHIKHGRSIYGYGHRQVISHTHTQQHWLIYVSVTSKWHVFLANAHIKITQTHNNTHARTHTHIQPGSLPPSQLLLWCRSVLFNREQRRGGDASQCSIVSGLFCVVLVCLCVYKKIAAYRSTGLTWQLLSETPQRRREGDGERVKCHQTYLLAGNWGSSRRSQGCFAVTLRPKRAEYTSLIAARHTRLTQLVTSEMQMRIYCQIPSEFQTVLHATCAVLSALQIQYEETALRIRDTLIACSTFACKCLASSV